MHLIAASNTPNFAALRDLRGLFPFLIRTKTQSELLLPIHVAALNSNNVELLRELMKMYPEGVSTPDKEGKIIEHHICENASDAALNMLEMVLEANPNNAKIATLIGVLPLHLAILNENITEPIKQQMITLLLKLYPEGVNQLFIYDGLPTQGTIEKRYDL